MAKLLAALEAGVRDEAAETTAELAGVVMAEEKAEVAVDAVVDVDALVWVSDAEAGIRLEGRTLK